MSKKTEGSTGKTLLIVGGVALAAYLIYPKIKEDLKNALSGAIPDFSSFFDAISGGIGDLGSSISGGLSGINIPPITVTIPSLDTTDITDWLTKYLGGLGAGAGDTITPGASPITEKGWTEKIKGGAINIAEGLGIVGVGYGVARYIAPSLTKATGGVIERLASKLFATKTAFKTAKVVSKGEMGVEALGPTSATKGFPLKYSSKWIRPSGLGGLFGTSLLITAMPGFTAMIWNPLKAWVGGLLGQPISPPQVAISGQPTQIESQAFINYFQAHGGVVSTPPVKYYYQQGAYQPGTGENPPLVQISGHPTTKEKSAFYAYYKAHGGV